MNIAAFLTGTALPQAPGAIPFPVDAGADGFDALFASQALPVVSVSVPAIDGRTGEATTAEPPLDPSLPESATPSVAAPVTFSTEKPVLPAKLASEIAALGAMLDRPDLAAPMKMTTPAPVAATPAAPRATATSTVPFDPTVEASSLPAVTVDRGAKDAAPANPMPPAISSKAPLPPSTPVARDPAVLVSKAKPAEVVATAGVAAQVAVTVPVPARAGSTVVAKSTAVATTPVRAPTQRAPIIPAAAKAVATLPARLPTSVAAKAVVDTARAQLVMVVPAVAVPQSADPQIAKSPEPTSAPDAARLPSATPPAIAIAQRYAASSVTPETAVVPPHPSVQQQPATQRRVQNSASALLRADTSAPDHEALQPTIVPGQAHEAATPALVQQSIAPVASSVASPVDGPKPEIAKPTAAPVSATAEPLRRPELTPPTVSHQRGATPAPSSQTRALVSERVPHSDIDVQPDEPADVETPTVAVVLPQTVAWPVAQTAPDAVTSDDQPRSIARHDGATPKARSTNDESERVDASPVTDARVDASIVLPVMAVVAPVQANPDVVRAAATVPEREVQKPVSANPSPIAARADPAVLPQMTVPAPKPDASASPAPIPDTPVEKPSHRAAIAERADPAPAAPSAAPLAVHRADAVVQAAPELAVTRHLDLARGDAWLDTLARDIAATATDTGRLKFALAPETMGRLEVEVRREDAGVHVHMTARNEAARDVLTAAQPRIADEIRAHGVRLAGTEVSAGFNGERSNGTFRASQAIETALYVDDAQDEPTTQTMADGRYA